MSERAATRAVEFTKRAMGVYLDQLHQTKWSRAIAAFATGIGAILAFTEGPEALGWGLIAVALVLFWSSGPRKLPRK